MARKAYTRLVPCRMSLLAPFSFTLNLLGDHSSDSFTNVFAIRPGSVPRHFQAYLELWTPVRPPSAAATGGLQSHTDTHVPHSVQQEQYRASRWIRLFHRWQGLYCH